MSWNRFFAIDLRQILGLKLCLLFVRNEKGTNSLGTSDITEHNTVLSVNTSGWVGYTRALTATFQCAMDLKVIIN